MPYLSAPGGGGDSVEVDSLTITAAISTGFGAGGGGSNNPMQGWHIERHPSDPGDPFVDISFKPDPQNCNEARFLLGQAKQKQTEFNTLKNVFDNDHADIAQKIAEKTIGLGALLGIGASMAVIWNKVKEVRAAIMAELGMAGSAAVAIGALSVGIVLYIDRDRWDAVVAQAQADKDRLCGSGSA
ncbi:MAG: hypothetical protein KAG62_06895 [Caulobacter sp.]|uniref:hypothetical protein n=1 Tax=Caulobacter sp. CCH9-E1 TaxID=1768768 RepID=UPI0012E390D1|nr:hypothetical protein [Caulobacter sp. CCH9-E1]MCK5909663.1 hypothetical protein [Caulobacter sp.]